MYEADEFLCVCCGKPCDYMIWSDYHGGYVGCSECCKNVWADEYVEDDD